MGMTKKDQAIVGVGLIAVGLVGFGMLALMPQVDAITAGWTSIESTKKQLAQLELQKSTLESHIAQYRDEKKIPQDIILRTYKPGRIASVMKEMVGTIVSMATQNGSTLISLKPVGLDAPFGKDENGGGNTPPPTGPTPVAPPEPVATSATTAAAPNPVEAVANAVTGNSSEPAAPPKPLSPGLQGYGYDLVVRGSYSNIQSFLASLNKNKELIEVSNILIENEAGSERQDTDGIKSDFSRPIKLTTRLKLILLPDKPVAQLLTATPATAS